MKKNRVYAATWGARGASGCWPGCVVGEKPLQGSIDGGKQKNFCKRISHSLAMTLSIGIAIAGLTVNSARASTLFESAALGLPTQSGAQLSLTQWLAAPFSLSSTKTVTAIGGHIGGNGLFGAIIGLSGPNALPSFLPSQLANNAIAHTVINGDGAALSSDRLAPISATLAAGEYAVVFGTGLFGTNGGGIMTSNNADLTNSSLIFSSLRFPENLWRNFSTGTATTLRFVVEGSDNISAVPLPAALPLFLTGLSGMGLLRRRRRRQQA